MNKRYTMALSCGVPAVSRPCRESQVRRKIARCLDREILIRGFVVRERERRFDRRNYVASTRPVVLFKIQIWRESRRTRGTKVISHVDTLTLLAKRNGGNGSATFDGSILLGGTRSLFDVVCPDERLHRFGSLTGGFRADTAAE